MCEKDSNNKLHLADCRSRTHTKIPTAKRSGALPGLCAALKEIFVNSKWNNKVFEILENKILLGNNNTGRPGMDLWQIFMFSQVRLCLNISYDQLHHIANYDSLIRQLMGIENGFGLVNKKTTKQLDLPLLISQLIGLG